MPWLEQLQDRGQSNKHWLDTDTGKGRVVATTGSFHYESVLDSGNFDTDRDFTLVRVDNNQIDGYEISTNSFFFRIQTEPRQGQQPDIGAVGFGGRQAEHWIYQRVTNFGYAHRPTESLQNLLTLNYNAANVTVSQRQSTVGPLAQVITANARIEWTDVLQFPNGGSGDIIWNISGRGLVEKVHIDQLGRDWLAANPQDVTWTDADTYVGFLADLDYTDIPRRLLRGVVLGNNDRVWDDGDPLILENASQQLIGVLPTTRAFVPGRGGSARIDKYIHRQGNQHRFMFGITMADYANFGPGEVIFDPPVTETVQATADDGYEDGYGAWSSGYSGSFYMGQSGGGTTYDQDAACRWLTVVGPEADATIDTGTATASFRRNGGSGTVQLTIDCDIGTGRENALGSGHRPDSGWTAGTSVNTTVTGGAGGGNIKTTGAFDAALVDLFANANGGWNSGENICISFRNNSNANGTYLAADEQDGAEDPQLDFTYTNPGGGGGRIMSSLAFEGGLAGTGGIAGSGGGLAG